VITCHKKERHVYLQTRRFSVDIASCNEGNLCSTGGV